jgi:hypothetical protein
MFVTTYACTGRSSRVAVLSPVEAQSGAAIRRYARVLIDVRIGLPAKIHGRVSRRYCRVVRGDRVEIVIDAGGEVRTYEVVATRNGRRVEINTGRGVVEVTEVTRGGTPVRSARFMANRILALVEHPASDRNIAEEVIEPPSKADQAL